MMKRVVRVYSKNFIDDFVMRMKNIIGGRLKSYEEMVNKGIDECISELGPAKNVKIEMTELSNESIVIIVYGDVK